LLSAKFSKREDSATVAETLGCFFGCRKGEASCVRQFLLHRQQIEKDRPKQNVEISSLENISADAHANWHNFMPNY